MAATHSKRNLIAYSPHPNIRIEKMQTADLDEVLRIEALCFSMPWTLQMFETELNDPKISFPLLARWIENQEHPETAPICGYCVFWHIVDEIHIGNLAIAPDYRRKGIAAHLLEYIVQLSKEWKIRQISLEVRLTNHAAIQLYESFGFYQAAIRKQYYSNPIEDAIVMIREDNIDTSTQSDK
jgi:[ribosomal protein S18]-alanine N-acetyltransferase